MDPAALSEQARFNGLLKLLEKTEPAVALPRASNEHEH